MCNFQPVLSPSVLQLPEVHPNAKLLRPPVPIVHTENNWPLLTVAKGFFDGGLSSKPGATDLAASAMMDEEGDWGEDAMLDLDEGIVCWGGTAPMACFCACMRWCVPSGQTFVLPCFHFMNYLIFALLPFKKSSDITLTLFDVSAEQVFSMRRRVALLVC